MIININSQIVSLVNLSENTVRKYIKEYEEGGIEKLKEINFYRPESELLEYKETLEKYFEKNQVIEDVPRKKIFYWKNDLNTEYE